jgi:RHS repeat-associated protein
VKRQMLSDVFTRLSTLVLTAIVAMVGLGLAPTRASAQVTPINAANDEIEYYHADAVSTIRMVTNANGAVLHRYDFTPSGANIYLSVPMNGPQYGGPTTEQPMGFAGKELDLESGFSYFGARYLLATSGRFTTPDPVIDLAASLEDPQRWARYPYARNNPMRYVDPDGRWLDTVLDIAFLAYDVYDIGRSVVRGEGVSGTQLMAAGADLAGVFIPVATGGGSAVRAAAKVDALAHAAPRGIDAVQSAQHAAGRVSKVPNPGGKLGGPEHRAKVEEVVADVKSRGLKPQTELRVDTPGGAKGTRYVDVAGVDPKTGKVTELHQVGKKTKGGEPVSRERKAIDDIEKARPGDKVTFHPYNH